MPLPVTIGIAGGTGSGKSTIADAIQKEVKQDITIITQDSYYKSFESMSLKERSKINYDHPQSLDNKRFINHIRSLKKGVPINMPTYNFETHLRAENKIPKKPTKIIIGIVFLLSIVFHYPPRTLPSSFPSYMCWNGKRKLSARLFYH